MMWKDEIVEETRQAREAYTARFNYDIAAICRDLKAKEAEEKRPIVVFAPKTLLELPAVTKPPVVSVPSIRP